jgi:diguanylate cyclase (GGDEF)-like protein/PAS domain S-box-containing protein
MPSNPNIASAALDSSLDGILVLDLDAEPLYWNRTYERLWGVESPKKRRYSAQELQACITAQLAPAPDNISDFLVAVQPSPQTEFRHFRTLDGRWLQRRVTDFLHQGRKQGLLIAWTDVTQDHQRILDGERERELLSELIENVPDQIYFKDKASRFIKINPSLAKRYRLDQPADAVGLSDADFYSPEHAAQTRQEEMAIMRSGFGVYNQLHHEKWQDGHESWNISTKMPLRDNTGGIIGTFGISHDITEHKEKEALIWRQAHHDGLTGLPNRLLLTLRWEQLQTIAERIRSGLALLMIDLDHFKDVNDTLGHNAGDQLIQQVAQRLQKTLRASDTVARLGGDEFAVVLNHMTEPIVAAELAQKIIHELTEPFAIGDHSVFVTASIGIALFPNDGRSLEELFRHADQSMYQAKAQGRNRFSFYTASMEDHARRRLSLGMDLRRALVREQLHLVYQPVIALATGEVAKAEVLLRWNHPELGPIGPAEFIPIAESHGLIGEIGDWVLIQGLQQLQRWHQQGFANLKLAINQSPLQMARPQSSSLDLPRTLQRMGIPGQAVVVEITEGVLLQPSAGVRDRLQRLTDHGVCLAIDDFGTGYSALSYLHQFDIQLLKIDRSFVHNMVDSAKNLAICRSIIQMAKALGIAVVAEGVETEQQHLLLCEAGCDFGQGYWYSRPMDSMAFEAWLAARHTQPQG